MLPSREGSQQGDPMSSLEFCEAMQPVLNDLDSEVNIGLMNDVSLSSDVSTLKKTSTPLLKQSLPHGLGLIRPNVK